MTNSVPSEGSDPQKDPTHPEGSWEAVRKWIAKNRSQVLFFLGGLALYLLLGLFLWWLLQLYVDPSSIKDPSKEATAKKDLLQALGFIMAGVAGAIGIYFTWRGQRLTQESTQEELRITREGQITDRFTRAIDQLGASDDNGEPRLEIRLGGIYALERIDKESPERAYHGTVMEVLTAYVRENSHRTQEERSKARSASNEGVEQDKGVAQEQDAQQTLQRVTTDIQAILDVLNRREEERVPKEHRVRLDLREAYLQEADLQGAILIEANLYRANLQRATLRDANFQRATLLGANLQGAELGGANLQRATLRDANLQWAYLAEAILYGAILIEANLQDANLQGANLQGANLQDAKVADEQLADALSLQGATMPDGQILQGDEVPDGPTFKEWLQGGEGRGKDVENE